MRILAAAEGAREGSFGMISCFFFCSTGTNGNEPRSCYGSCWFNLCLRSLGFSSGFPSSAYEACRRTLNVEEIDPIAREKLLCAREDFFFWRL
jgi:hypothetical protein